MASPSRPSQVSLTSESSSTSLVAPLRDRSRKFRVRELLPHLSLMAAHIDFPAVALGWCSNEVIEINQAQELLKFTGDERDKCLKVLEVYIQLKRHEDRVPFFLGELLKSGESSVTNQSLYDRLSDEMDFTDFDIQNACKRSTELATQRRKSRASSSSSGVDSSTESARKCPSPQHLLDIPAPQKSNFALQQENNQLHQENSHLQKKIEQLQEMLIETQKNLVSAQQELIISQNEKRLKQRPSITNMGRRRSIHSQSTEDHQTRIRKLSRSLDSIQQAVMMMQFDTSPDTEYPPTGFPTSPLRKKSYK